VPHKFQVGDKVWLHLQKEHLTGPHQKLRPLSYGPYTITKAMGDNSFELNIPPFLGLHPVFNVDLLRPYFPPLLDTSEVAEQMTPKEINPDNIQQPYNDHIVDTQIKGTQQQRIHLYRVRQIRAAPTTRQVAHPEPNSTEIYSSDGGPQCNGDHLFLRRDY
jgi:hypothetical protein